MMRLTVGIHRGIIHHVVILSSHVFSPMPGYLQRAVDRIVTCTQMVKVKEHHFGFEHDSRIQKIHVSHHYLCFSAIITILIPPRVSDTDHFGIGWVLETAGHLGPLLLFAWKPSFREIL